MAAGIAEGLGFVSWPPGPTLIILSACVVSLYYIRPKRAARLPPGPRGLPFVGNVLQVPNKQHWLRFAEMGDVWGDVCSLTVLGKTMVIVNSLKVTEDLLDARGTNFSDRPIIPVGGELGGFDNALPLVHYGDRMRKERKLFHRLFGTQASVKQFAPLISTEVHKLLRNIVLNPDGLIDEIARATGAISLRIAFGYHLRDGPTRDPLLEMFETGGNNFMISSTPAAFVADIIPILRFWPEWLPGGGFHTIAKAWSKQIQSTVDTGLQYVKNEMAAGKAEPSFVSTLLEEKSHEDYLIKWAAASIQIGGSDTTAAQLEAFFLAMSLYPAVQAAAQRELDRVVGNDRLPDISDRAQLPYIDALCKEVVRWHVAAPLAVPHCTREDYIYERGGGMEPLLIPKDSLVIPNLWKMAHDPARYTNPMAFDPSRFLANWEGNGKKVEQDPADICFGYGRRVCPGRLLGETAIFLECSAVLSVFNISKARDEKGVIIEPELGQTSATVSHVLPFKCVVKPRNARALALIQGS
ncbi:cytochrome P450 [Mycena albidolilacea]|uniref:Cytochrome P450 n=1 Tax=Mycena albidolilacea TaxID=1033008 RepID=A0AAD7A5U8_9AGAR|nr:cytochrome P450 [Mycena albidolilacea]